MVKGIDELYSGTSELKGGTAQMYDETAGMNKKISDTGFWILLIKFLFELSTGQMYNKQNLL